MSKMMTPEQIEKIARQYRRPDGNWYRATGHTPCLLDHITALEEQLAVVVEAAWAFRKASPPIDMREERAAMKLKTALADPPEATRKMLERMALAEAALDAFLDEKRGREEGPIDHAANEIRRQVRGKKVEAYRKEQEQR